MPKVLILGAGRIGASIGQLLLASGCYQLSLADRSAEVIAQLPEALKPHTLVLDVYQEKDLEQAMHNVDAVLSACSFKENPLIARMALKTGCSYFDLTEDVECTRAIMSFALQARPDQVFMPQCGLAPGFIGILGYDLCKRLDTVFTLKMRVGALPEFPTNQIMYNLTWSTDGLINEYCNPCEAIKNWKYSEVLPLEGLESFSLDGTEYEAFNTSGGLGTLCQTLNGKIQDLTYKTIRYPGHRYLMDFLIHDLRLGKPGHRRDMLKTILESAIAVTQQDIVLILASATGFINKRLTEISEVIKIYHKDLLGSHWSAIQISTASAACVVLDLFFQGKLANQGFIKQEEVTLQDFMQSPFAEPFLLNRRI